MITLLEKDEEIVVKPLGSSNSDRRNAYQENDSQRLAKVAREYSHRIELELLSRARERTRLRQSEQRYRDFFENAKDVMYVHDLTGRYTLVNRAAERLMGYAKNELLKMSIDEVVPAEYVEKVRGIFQQKLT